MIRRGPLRWPMLWLVLLGFSAHLDASHEAPSRATSTRITESEGPAMFGVGAESASTCESRTINYVTHSLPQQCLKSSWSAPHASKSRTEPTLVNDETAPSMNPSDPDRIEEANMAATPTTESFTMDELGSPVMPFEDWKELMLRRQVQGSPDGQGNRHSDSRPRTERQAEPLGPDTTEEEGELADGGPYDGAGEAVVDMQEVMADGAAEHELSDKVLYDDGKTQYYRSSDAGKTCKERFSYSSFDAGATVLKTGPGAKNPKAILLENKDSYMLLECAAENKYVIVELSDDILVDTVVLANFEFFSSMIRHFRVSVSDRYPVKTDKWRDLGTFEARNSRDIQPFLVENPQIWAKYVRIEFLSHYGNEYYCPMSLLRIHGTRMLESWKDTEPDSGHEEEGGYDDDGTGARPPTYGIDDGTQISQDSIIDPQDNGTSGISLVLHNFPVWSLTDSTCPANSSPTTGSQADSGAQEETRIKQPKDNSSTHRARAPVDSSDPESAGSASHATSQSLPSTGTSIDVPNATDPSVSTPTAGGDQPVNATVSFKAQSNSSSPTTSAASTKSSDTPPTPPKNKTSTAVASASAASPTVQESFFKTVSKRLQLVESNMTWSIKYVEDQTRNLQDALVHIEKKRLVKVEALLESLNRTFLSELDSLRQQYDQMWQSTIIALETQREQSQREIVAVSSRLNVLADEVVFQKRMSIGQSVLLLSCLILIIFSRSLAAPAPPLRGRMPSPSLSPAHSFQTRGGAPAGLDVGGPQHPNGPRQLRPSYAASASRAYHGVSPPPSPSAPAELGGLAAEKKPRDGLPRQPQAGRSLGPQMGVPRKPLPALPEYPDIDDQTPVDNATGSAF